MTENELGDVLAFIIGVPLVLIIAASLLATLCTPLVIFLAAVKWLLM